MAREFLARDLGPIVTEYRENNELRETRGVLKELLDTAEAVEKS